MKNLYLFAQYISDDALPKPNTNTSVETIVNTVFVIFGTIAVLIVVYAGVQLIISQGNSEKVATARRSIIYAIAGLLVILLSWSIVSVIIGRVST